MLIPVTLSVRAELELQPWLTHDFSDRFAGRLGGVCSIAFPFEQSFLLW